MKNFVVDVVSPASSITEAELSLIRKILLEAGFKSRFFLQEKLLLKNAIDNNLPAFAAVDRFEQLKQALIAADSDVIWCARGGYGSGDLLPLLQKMPKPKRQKIIVGFSDITSLTTFFVQSWGWSVVAAPMLNQIAKNKVTKAAQKRIFKLLRSKLDGKEIELKYALKPLNKGITEVSGIIVGGCLTVLCAEFFTNNQLNWRDKILFLEDIGESGERIDRYLRQIVFIIKEKQLFPKAILLGNFKQDNPKKSYKVIELALNNLVNNLVQFKINVPVFIEKSECLGHAKNMKPLVLGASAVIENYELRVKS